MKGLIKGYVNAEELLSSRIKELHLYRNTTQDDFEKQGYDTRIRLLNEERHEVREIIRHLNSYVRRVEERVQKNNLL